jgi:hypothetical protein
MDPRKPPPGWTAFFRRAFGSWRRAGSSAGSCPRFGRYSGVQHIRCGNRYTRGTPGVVSAGGERVLTDPSGGAVRLDRLLEGVPHGVITRTEVYTSREDGKTVPLLRISEGD